MPSQTKLDNYMMLAAKMGNDEELESLIDQGANVHAFKGIVLKIAAVEGYLSAVEILLKRGCDIHADDDAALRGAVDRGHENIVEYLLGQGADFKVLETDQQERYKDFTPEAVKKIAKQDALIAQKEQAQMKRNQQRALRRYVHRP